MFKLNSKKSTGDKIKGILSFLVKPIPYEVLIPSGNWSSYFGHYENQKWGQWDSNSCWALSAINCLEDQLEFLWKEGAFGPEAKLFFQNNGYVDADGDFSLSERWLEVLSGAKDNGNNQMEAWVLMQKYGVIPRSDLNYSLQQAQKFSNKTNFNADYFNIHDLSDEMYTKAAQFLKYVNISRQWIGKNWSTPDLQLIKAALRQAPVQIGVPVPRDVTAWNNQVVNWDGSTSADHAVELYGINDHNQYLIFDQYLPNLKVLSADYYLPFVCQGIAVAVPQVVTNPVPQNKVDNSVWQNVLQWWNRLFPGSQPSAVTA